MGVRATVTALVVAMAAVLAGCGDGAKEAAAPVPPTGGGPAPVAGGGAAAPAALPADLFATAAPAGAKGVLAVKKEAKEGETVVLRGKVGGSVAPFLAGRAVLSIVDTDGMVSCEAMPDDACPTPWDYCCEEPNRLAEGSATVQVVGADGRPLKAPLEGAGGLKPLRIVVVEGVVGPRPDPKVLVVNATRIHVEP